LRLVNDIHLQGAFITLFLSTKKLSTKQKAHSTCSVQFRLQRIITSLSLRIQMSKNACLTGFCQKNFYGHVYIEWIFIERNELPLKLQLKYLDFTFFGFITANAFCIYEIAVTSVIRPAKIHHDICNTYCPIIALCFTEIPFREWECRMYFIYILFRTTDLYFCDISDFRISLWNHS